MATHSVAVIVRQDAVSAARVGVADDVKGACLRVDPEKWVLHPQASCQSGHAMDPSTLHQELQNKVCASLLPRRCDTAQANLRQWCQPSPSIQRPLSKVHGRTGPRIGSASRCLCSHRHCHRGRRRRWCHSGEQPALGCCSAGRTARRRTKGRPQFC